MVSCRPTRPTHRPTEGRAWSWFEMTFLIVDKNLNSVHREEQRVVPTTLAVACRDYVWSHNEPYQFIHVIGWPHGGDPCGRRSLGKPQDCELAREGPEIILHLCGLQDSDGETRVWLGKRARRQPRVQKNFVDCCCTQCAMNCQVWLKSVTRSRNRAMPVPGAHPT